MLTTLPHWPLGRKILFRFFFIYIILSIEPWVWLGVIPGFSSLLDVYYKLVDGVVYFFNNHLLHVKQTLVMINGSGDTSYGWALEGTLLLLALMGCIAWSIVDRRRSEYSKLNYWLCLFTRYYLASVAFSYGLLKVLLLQMPFPSLSEMATPLGDLLPMRLSWVFLGASPMYQVFSGIAECTVALLLLYRRTATLGVLLAVGVFANVMMLNLSYDIPVKIFSMRLVLLSLFLFANEFNRIWCFFILHTSAPGCSLYTFNFQKPWMRWTRMGLKLVMLYIIVVYPLMNLSTQYDRAHRVKNQVIAEGIYEVSVFKKNNVDIPDVSNDTSRWREMVFENIGRGSLKTADSGFYNLYNRKYFIYETDSTRHAINFFHFLNKPEDKPAFSLMFDKPGPQTVRLWGKRNSDSLYIVLTLRPHSFQLAQKQFHWLSESNR